MWSRARIEIAIVVTRYDDFMSMGQRVQPIYLVLNIRVRARIGQIAGMNENIAWRNQRGRRVRMGIRDANYADFVVRIRWEGRAAERQKEGVEVPS